MQASEQKREKPRLSAEDWERAALEMISELGVGALAVEPLARRMGITKGSFYWHFANRETLLEQALNRWEEHDSRNLNASLSAISEPRDRLISFFRRVGQETMTHLVFSALCAASEHAQVEPVLERVADRRDETHCGCLRRTGFCTGKISPSGALDLLGLSGLSSVAQATTNASPEQPGI